MCLPVFSSKISNWNDFRSIYSLAAAKTFRMNEFAAVLTTDNSQKSEEFSRFSPPDLTFYAYYELICQNIWVPRISQGIFCK